MQKVIKITKDVLAVIVFLVMSYLMLKALFLAAAWSDWSQLYGEVTLCVIASMAIVGLSMLYALKKLL